MPIIATANPKGGAGKSTSSLVLATTLARKGASVRIIDTDQQQTIGKWAQGHSRYKDIVCSVTEARELVGVLDREAKQHQFVIIDVQGRATMTMARAMSRADLVLIPMQPKAADADEAAEAVQLIREEEETLRLKIDHRILFMRTNSAIPTKEEREIIESMKKVGVPSLKAHLNERTAFSRIIGMKCALDELDQQLVNGVPAALENAEAFAAEVVEIITGAQK